MNLATAIADIRRQLELIAYREDSFRSDAAKAGGRKRAKPPLCTVGTSCGFSCISKNVTCRKKLRDMFDGDGKAALNAIKRVVLKDFEKTRGMGKGGTIGIPAPSSTAQRSTPNAETRKKMKTIGAKPQTRPEAKQETQSQTRNFTRRDLVKLLEQKYIEVDRVKGYSEGDIERLTGLVDKAGGNIQPAIVTRDPARPLDFKTVAGHLDIETYKRLPNQDREAQVLIDQDPVVTQHLLNQRKILEQVDAQSAKTTYADYQASKIFTDKDGTGSNDRSDNLLANLVELRYIKPPKSKTDPKLVDQLAEEIRKAGGAIARPIVVERTGVLDYDIVYGATEYEAYKKAFPGVDLGDLEMTAIVLPTTKPEKRAAILEQIDFRNQLAQRNNKPTRSRRKKTG